jgi:hypothetical protein
MKLHQIVWCGDVLISVWILLLPFCEISSNIALEPQQHTRYATDTKNKLSLFRSGVGLGFWNLFNVHSVYVSVNICAKKINLPFNWLLY